jgi:hypothetical protein
MGGTGDIPAELREVPVEIGDEPLLTVLDVAFRLRGAHNDLQFVDECM